MRIYLNVPENEYKYAIENGCILDRYTMEIYVNNCNKTKWELLKGKVCKLVNCNNKIEDGNASYTTICMNCYKMIKKYSLDINYKPFGSYNMNSKISKQNESFLDNLYTNKPIDNKEVSNKLLNINLN